MDYHKRILSLVSFLVICLSLIEAQLTSTDLQYIKQSLLKSQEENGLFGKSLDNTYKAIFSLKSLGENVDSVPKICREISFEAINGVNLDIIQIDQLLGCKLTLPASPEISIENMKNQSLETIFKSVRTAEISGTKVDWKGLYQTLKSFLTEENLFSSVSDSKQSSLLSTTKGLHLLTSIRHNVGNNTQEVDETLLNVVQAVYKQFSLIRDDIGLFSEEGVASIRLNSEFVSALSPLTGLVKIENFESLLAKILNYLVTFKYDYSGVESIYYLVRGINTLNYLPLLSLKKNVIDYIDEPQVHFKLLNGFGKDILDYKVSFEYSLKEEQQEKSSGEYDLEDEPKEIQSLSTTVTASSDVNLNLSQLVKNSGKFSLKIKANFHNLKSNRSYVQSFLVDLTSFSKVKLNHLKLAVTNTGDKNDEKEITVEYPKRTFKNFKATQNSIIKVKVKFNMADNKAHKIEQVFLRLRHVELGKSYSAYVSEYKGSDDYYSISFDLSDSNYMDAYDGVYELTLIVSDIALDNPIIWNFGKIDVKFKKPLDPSNLSSSYKNPQKEKMEPYFPPEESPNKNIIVKRLLIFKPSLIFCGLILAIFTFYLIQLKASKANLNGFPRTTDTSKFFFSLAFLLFLVSVTYVIVLFFVKLNIIQTLLAFLVLGLPGAFITYKTLAKLTIEV